MRIADGVEYELAGGRAVILDPDGGEMLTLNEVGTVVWKHLAPGPVERADLVQAIRHRFSAVSEEEIERDLQHFLDELVDAGVLDE